MGIKDFVLEMSLAGLIFPFTGENVLVLNWGGLLLA